MNDKEHWLWFLILAGMFVIGVMVTLRYVEDRCLIHGKARLLRIEIKCDVDRK